MEPDDFHDRRHPAIFDIATDLQADGVPVEYSTVAGRLNGEVPIDLLTSLAAEPVSSLAALEHARVVLQVARERRAYQLASRVARTNGEPAELRRVLAELYVLLRLPAGFDASDRREIKAEIVEVQEKMRERRRIGVTVRQDVVGP